MFTVVLTAECPKSSCTSFGGAPLATKTEEIRTLKAGLSDIVRQHGFATVQDFYTAFYTAQRAIDAYQKECAKWDETYGEKATPKAETMHEKNKAVSGKG